METTRLIIVAVGGQGNLLASKVLGEAALDLTFVLNVLAVVAKMATAARWSPKTAKVFFSAKRTRSLTGSAGKAPKIENKVMRFKRF